MKFTGILFSVSVFALLAACTPGTNAPPAVTEPPVIGGQENHRLGAEPAASPAHVKIGIYNPKNEPEAEMTALRRDALRESAQTYGSQMGFARRAYEIGKILEQRASDFDQVFSFTRVVSAAPVKAGHVIPPVVSRSMNAFRTNADGREAAVSDEYLTIVRPGRIAPVVPTWRDYLLFSKGAPEEPAKSLLPSNGGEQKLFMGWFNEGWSAGVALADEELGNRLDRLRRDYEGMLQYRRLVALGMMDRMILEQADFGVTSDGNEMRIGSRTVRVQSDAEFQSNPLKWSVREVSAHDKGIVSMGAIPSLNMD